MTCTKCGGLRFVGPGLDSIEFIGYCCDTALIGPPGPGDVLMFLEFMHRIGEAPRIRPCQECEGPDPRRNGHEIQ